jgi:integrase
MARPKPIGFEVKKSAPFNGKEWRVTGYLDGKRKQFWFATEREARREAADRNREREAYGSKVNLDAEARLEAYRAAELLRPHGKTISDAVRYYLEHLEKAAYSVPFSDLAERVREEFARRLAKDEVSERHAQSLRETLRKLEARFGPEIVSGITVEAVREWLLGLPLAVKTRNRHRGYAGTIFNLALDYGYTTFNPVAKIKKFNERTNGADEISVLSAEETERLFRAVDPEAIPFLTLAFFCGIRRATLERLDWRDVRFAEKRVIVPGYKGKNGTRYQVTLQENALAFLRPYLRESGSLLAPARAINREGAAFGSPSPVATRRLIKEAASQAGLLLPDNAGRHTFISMHVAAFESIDKTALEADNSSEIIKKDYLDLVTREEAEKFWNICPLVNTPTNGTKNFGMSKPAKSKKTETTSPIANSLRRPNMNRRRPRPAAQPTE